MKLDSDRLIKLIVIQIYSKCMILLIFGFHEGPLPYSTCFSVTQPHEIGLDDGYLASVLLF